MLVNFHPPSFKLVWIWLRRGVVRIFDVNHIACILVVEREALSR